jgi:hypothetical protein
VHEVRACANCNYTQVWNVPCKYCSKEPGFHIRGGRCYKHGYVTSSAYNSSMSSGVIPITCTTCNSTGYQKSWIGFQDSDHRQRWYSAIYVRLHPPNPQEEEAKRKEEEAKKKEEEAEKQRRQEQEAARIAREREKKHMEDMAAAKVEAEKQAAWVKREQDRVALEKLCQPEYLVATRAVSILKLKYPQHDKTNTWRFRQLLQQLKCPESTIQSSIDMIARFKSDRPDSVSFNRMFAIAARDDRARIEEYFTEHIKLYDPKLDQVPGSPMAKFLAGQIPVLGNRQAYYHILFRDAVEIRNRVWTDLWHKSWINRTFKEAPELHIGNYPQDDLIQKKWKDDLDFMQRFWKQYNLRIPVPERYWGCSNPLQYARIRLEYYEGMGADGVFKPGYPMICGVTVDALGLEDAMIKCVDFNPGTRPYVPMELSDTIKTLISS